MSSYVSVQPLPASYHDSMMFNHRDRELLARLEAKIDVALNRVGAVESKQASHEAICDVRQKNFEDYVRRKESENAHAAAEWERFMEDSRSHRSRLELAFQSSHNTLLWKAIVAMFILLTGSIGALWQLIQHGVIR